MHLGLTDFPARCIHLSFTILFSFVCERNGWEGRQILSGLIDFPWRYIYLPYHNQNHLRFIIPPAYEVCRGVYSFRLSVRPFDRPSVRPYESFAWKFFLAWSFAWKFFLLHIFLKANTLGCWCVASVTTRWLHNSWHRSADAADPRSRSRT